MFISENMGVRGLTTYIRNNEKKFLKPYKLYNCTVLLDGNSIAANLYIWSNIESAFGGDYDKYAKYVKEFFKLLQKCEIKPLVLFDGGYEQRKLKTVYSRMKEKFRTACQAQPFTGSLNFPLFMRIVFREVLVEMGVPFAQSDFEADDELAALARQLRCPVISYDSDFYIYDVLYIPFPSLNLIPVEFKKSVEDGNDVKYYIECKIYSVEVFINSFGGLDKNMLPLLAALLGNDYIKRSVFKKFYTNLKIPKGKTNHLQRRIKAVIEWLRHETFESAVYKILGRMKKKSRRFVKKQLKKTVNGYVQCQSILSEYLGLSPHKTDLHSCILEQERNILNVDPQIVSIIDKININSIEDSTLYSEDIKINEDVDSVSSGEEGESSDSSDEEYEDDECSCEVKAVPGGTSDIEMRCIEEKKIFTFFDNTKSIPSWLLDYSRRGKIQSCVFDILSLHQYFFLPQVEDYSLPPSHLVSLKILNAIVGLLCGEKGRTVKYWTRRGSQLASYPVEPIYRTASLLFPPFDEIPETSETVRKTIFLEVSEVNIDLNGVPEDWHLFIVAIIFWLRNMTVPVATKAYLCSVIMSIVGMYTVDSHIGVHRNRQTFMRKYKNFLNKINETRCRTKQNKLESNKSATKTDTGEGTEVIDLNKQLANVSKEDCVVAFELLLPYHHLSEQIKMKPKLFCLTTVHAFAQFQSCLFHLMVFNSVLGFPFKDCVTSSLFSGTFVYNIYQNLSKRKNIGAYVETLLNSSPSLLMLYKMLVSCTEIYLTDVNLAQNLAKFRKKKKKSNKQKEVTEYLYENNDEDSLVFIDGNNMFSGLTLDEK